MGLTSKASWGTVGHMDDWQEEPTQEELDRYFEACARLRKLDLEDDWTVDWKDDYGPP